LQPGIYFINPKLKKVTLVEIGYNEYSQLRISEASDQQISFPSDTGYLIRVGVTVVWGIDPDHAAEIVNNFGNVDKVLEKVINPQLRSICRNIGSTYAARDFIQGEKREQFQRDMTAELRRVCAAKNVEVLLALVRDIDMAVQPGEFVAITGPSGSGKSSLLYLLGLLDRPSEGEIFLEGQATRWLDEAARARLRLEKIGFVFQFFHLIPRLTALENVELPLLLAGEAPRTRRARAREVLESVGLGPRIGHRPDQLSGGERQRVAIGRAIVMSPDVILADEPTGNLDSSSGGEIVGIIEQLNRDGIAVVVVTHDGALGRRAARHLRMMDGKIVSDDKPAVA